MQRVEIYDTTLRDGSQREGVSLSVSDKLKIASKLDDLGISYIEGGWPGSNPKDIEFFKMAANINFKNARLCAFGSTRRPGCSAADDPNIQSLVGAGTATVTLFGKSWDFHVHDALKTSLEENLAMIKDSVSYLKSLGREVIYDAEHFFDGYKSNPEYALATLEAAVMGGADVIVLCDTNGGLMPWELVAILPVVGEKISMPLGIHVHDDAGMAVANSLLAVRHGIVQIHGTINGYGERCGNANLCTIIPNLQLKMGLGIVSPEQLQGLTKLSRYIAELANIVPAEQQPYVGFNAFAHKGGVHVDAVSKVPATYEHIDPCMIGNQRRILVSELAGRSSIILKANENNIILAKDRLETASVLKQLKEMEHCGYQFEGAEGSFELLVFKAMGVYKPLFQLEGFRLIVEKKESGQLYSEATIKVLVGDQQVHTAAEGNGPVNALDNALRKALEGIYPALKNIKLMDFKVRVIDGVDGTGAKVRVLIESRDDMRSWGTVGVSSNVIEASWLALVDSLEYGLLCRKLPEMEEAKNLLEQLKTGEVFN
ncbi:MAG TPA: citramalate synthase [Candidatus Limnocylindrales bacterium]|nr:citramalate synthase [Candidatus Limnocylindrales bacterium]